MNKTILLGRLTKEPDVTYTDNSMCIAKYTLAVDRRFKKDGEQTADFIRCVAFGKNGEFAEKYFHKGTKIIIEGHIQTGSYQNKEGQTVYTTDVIIDGQEFAESKAVAEKNGATTTPETNDNDGFMTIPDDVDDSGLPFNF